MRSRLPLLVPALLVLLASCGGKDPQFGRAAGNPAVPATTATVIQKAVPVQIRAIGNVQPYSTVSIKAQISGELFEVHFEEGQYVKKGQLLFTIDPRPFQAALKQAQATLQQAKASLKQAIANLAKDTADAKNADAQSARYAELYHSGVVALEQYDQYRTSADAYKAALEADRSAIQAGESTVAADEAAVETARLQLEYTSIRSPIDGRTGNLMVKKGNLVKANDVPILVVINEVHPIYVSFAVPAQNLPDIKRFMAQGSLKVEAIPKDGGPHSSGKLTFIDNSIDTTTSTIQLKGTFNNEDNALWPGEFVDAVLTLTMRPAAVLVASQALQSGQQGQYVFVVNPDQTVTARPVVAGPILDQMTVIESGLKPGEKVVTDGQLRLVPGAKIEEAAGPDNENGAAPTPGSGPSPGSRGSAGSASPAGGGSGANAIADPSSSARSGRSATGGEAGPGGSPSRGRGTGPGRSGPSQ